jgi:hypothetical protein
VPSNRDDGARRADHSRPSSADVKNEWSCTSFAPVCLHGQHRENFTFLTPSGEWSIFHAMDRCFIFKLLRKSYNCSYERFTEENTCRECAHLLKTVT